MSKSLKLAYVLAADVGNTRIRLGCVQADQVFVAESVAADDRDALGQLLRQYWDALEKPRRLVAASVNPHGLALLESVAAEQLEEPVLVIGRDIGPPIDTALPHPERIGTDRLCAAAAAYLRLQQACVVVDFGTAITIDCVSAEGQFLGGSILPGLRMQSAALHENTAQLPEVELSQPDWTFGRDTREAIVGGIVRGARGAMRAIVEAYATELNTWPTVVTTGGDAELIGREEDFVQAIVPNLSLMGIAMALYRSLMTVEQLEAAEDQPDEDEEA